MKGNRRFLPVVGLDCFFYLQPYFLRRGHVPRATSKMRPHDVDDLHGYGGGARLRDRGPTVAALEVGRRLGHIV